jgi:hypothetical protein
MGDHQTYALQIVHWTYVGPSDVWFANSTPDVRGTTGRTLLFEYPLGNTWNVRDTFWTNVQRPPDVR